MGVLTTNVFVQRQTKAQLLAVRCNEGLGVSFGRLERVYLGQMPSPSTLAETLRAEKK